MAYKLTFKTLDLPRLCPVCDEKRTDAAAVATHNIKSAYDGCRSYLASHDPMRYVQRVGVSRIGND